MMVGVVRSEPYYIRNEKIVKQKKAQPCNCSVSEQDFGELFTYVRELSALRTNINN